MTITYWLNGKKATADVAPGLMLYDFLRSQGVTASNAAVKRRTVASVRSGSTMCLCCRVPCWLSASTAAM